MWTWTLHHEKIPLLCPFLDSSLSVTGSSAPSPGETLDHAAALSPALSLAPSPFAPDRSPSMDPVPGASQGCDPSTQLSSAGSDPAESGPGGSYLGLKRWATLSRFSFCFYPWLCLWLIFYLLPSFSYVLVLLPLVSLLQLLFEFLLSVAFVCRVSQSPTEQLLPPGSLLLNPIFSLLHLPFHGRLSDPLCFRMSASLLPSAFQSGSLLLLSALGSTAYLPPAPGSSHPRATAEREKTAWKRSC